MHVIVIGCGKVGSKFAQILSDEGHDVVIVDNDSSLFKALGPNFNGITVTGVPIDQDVLKHAGIETADAFAAVTPDDNINIMACQIAKEIFKVPRVIARIYNLERERVFHLLGLDTICPTNLTVDAIHTIILEESSTVTNVFGSSTVIFKQVGVNKKDIGKKYSSIELEPSASIFGIVKSGIFDFADPNMSAEQGDIIVIATKIEHDL